MLNNSYECNKISSYESLTKIQQGEIDICIKALIKGALTYRKEFTVSDVVGGKWSDWSDSPLDYIYQYHVKRGCPKPETESGKDMGRIFKYIMAKDKFLKFKLVGTEQRNFPINKYALDE